MMNKEEIQETKWWWGLTLKTTMLILFTISIFMYGCPAYRVYTESHEGEAEYERAKQNRKVMFETAKAQNEAAISKAQAQIKMAEAHNKSVVIRAKGDALAEIERAKGVSEANKI